MNSKTTFLLLILLFVFSVLIRMPFLSVPLERDEGVRALIAQGMLEGDLPYRDLHTDKPPLVPFLYISIFKIFGQTTEDIHFFMYLYTLISVYMIFILARMLSKDNLAALVSAFFLSISTMSPKVYGNAANLEIFMILPIIVSVIFIYMAFEKNAMYLFFLSGLSAGLAFWTKQSGIFILFSLLGFILYEALVRKAVSKARCFKIIFFLLGGFLVISLMAAYYFWSNNILNEAIRWIFQYPVHYLLKTPFQWERFWRITKPIISENIMLYIFLVIALPGFLRERSRVKGLLFFWLTFSLFAIFAGFRFLPHYYIQAFPPLAILSGFGAAKLGIKLGQVRLRILARMAAIIIILLSIFIPLKADYKFLFTYTPAQISRQTYRSNPIFAESYKIAEYIRQNTAPSDLILVAGNEPQIYFYAKRRSATGYIFFDHLLKNIPYDGALQEQAYDEIKKNRPVYIAWFLRLSPTMAIKASDMYLLNKLGELARDEYEMDAIGVNIIRDVENYSGSDKIERVYYFGDKARSFAPTDESRIFMFLLKRKPS